MVVGQNRDPASTQRVSLVVELLPRANTPTPTNRKQRATRRYDTVARIVIILPLSVWKTIRDIVFTLKEVD